MSDASKVFRATHRFARIAPRKARLVADLVRGLPVNDALTVLQQNPRRGAALLHKVVKSALANASNDMDVNLNALYVRDIAVDKGPLLGFRARWRPRAMGRATPIQKWTSHLKVGLVEGETTRRRKGRRGAPESAPAEETSEEPATAES